MFEGYSESFMLPTDRAEGNIGDMFGMEYLCPPRYPDSQIEEIIRRFDLALSSMCQRRTLFEVLKDVEEGC